MTGLLISTEFCPRGPGVQDPSKRQAIAGTTGSGAAGSAAGTGAAVSGHAGYETQRRGRPVVANLQGTGMEQGYRPDAKRAEKKDRRRLSKKGSSMFNKKNLSEN